MKEKQDKSNSIHQQLVDAAGNHDLLLIKQLLKKGANINYVRYTNSDAWYTGNTDTALYTAVHSDFKGNQTNYVDVLQQLINNGANVNFKARRGGWNHSSQYPLLSGVARKLNKFNDQKQKIKFIEIFVKNGININQSENHGRSKNWRSYNTHTCFVFQMMDGCGITSKIPQLAKLCQQINIYQINIDKQKQLRQQFQNQFPQYKQNQQKVEKIENQAQNKNKQKQKIPQVSFIKALIGFGADPNSYSSASFWEDYHCDDYQGQENNVELRKFNQRTNETYETFLHRAIMNNLSDLVDLLIQRGAKLDKKCKFTIQVPVYPNDWPKLIKQRKKQQNFQMLKNAQIQKQKIEFELEGQVSQQRKKQALKDISYYEYQIFKSKRFAIENQIPLTICKNMQLSCIELAHKFNVSQQIITILTAVNNKNK